MPAAFSPPKAALASSLMCQSLRWVMPASIRRATRRPRATSQVKTALASPYSVPGDGGVNGR
jgi:hypothetical protein